MFSNHLPLCSPFDFLQYSEFFWKCEIPKYSSWDLQMLSRKNYFSSIYYLILKYYVFVWTSFKIHIVAWLHGSFSLSKLKVFSQIQNIPYLEGDRFQMNSLPPQCHKDDLLSI